MPRGSKKKTRAKPVILVILEGWGIAPAHPGNAITEARPEYFNYLLNHYPALALTAAGPELGMEATTSEAGHLLIGGGRPLVSSRRLVDAGLTGGLQKLPVLRTAFKKSKGGRVHLVGLLSVAEREAVLSHAETLIEAAREFGASSIYLHGILDGRDSAPRAGRDLVAGLEQKLSGIGSVASLSGRFYALDPYRHAARLDKAVQAIVAGSDSHFASTDDAFTSMYGKQIFDEEFSPSVIGTAGEAGGTIKDGDIVIFYNLEAAGIRPLAERIVVAVPGAHYFSLNDYRLEAITPLFAASSKLSSLGSVIADSGYRQSRISDSEGFAAVTACLNNGREAALVGEDRMLIPSPVREQYEDEAGTADDSIVREVVRATELQAVDFIAVTFASLDRIAHEMDIWTASAAVRSLDAALKKIVAAALHVGGVVAITSSHGLAEQTIMPNDPGSRHAGSLVPFLLVGKEFEGFSLGHPQPIDGDLSLVPAAGTLADVAPTLLELLQLPVPGDMAGKSLIASRT